MTRHSAHGSFAIERSFTAPPARVFAAWADVPTKARWFGGPESTWRAMDHALDFVVGGREVIDGEFSNKRPTRYDSRFHVIEPNRRLVYTYDMFADGILTSVSLVTVDFVAEGRGTRILFMEQLAQLSGDDMTPLRQAAAAGILDRLEALLTDRRELVSVRTFDAPRDLLFNAFRDPGLLAMWWGPDGFTNRFETFEFKPGGAWRFAMTGPDGKTHEMDKRFKEIVPEKRIVLDHVQTQHHFALTIEFLPLEHKTMLVWRMHFADEQPEDVMAYLPLANEENFDRLAAIVKDRRSRR